MNAPAVFVSSIFRVDFTHTCFGIARSVNVTKLQSIQRGLEAQLARDHNLKEMAQRAFISYIKSVFFMKDKQIFDVSRLDTDAFAR